MIISSARSLYCGLCVCVKKLIILFFFFLVYMKKKMSKFGVMGECYTYMEPTEKDR